MTNADTTQSPPIERTSSAHAAPHRTSRSIATSPWVPIPKRVRLVIVGAVILFAVSCDIAAMVNSSRTGSAPLLAFSTFTYLAVLIAPLVAYDPEKQGWFHPLVFCTLKTVALVLPRSIPLFVYGMTEHAVLALSPEELTDLVAYGNFLGALALLSTYLGFYCVKNPKIPNLRFHARVNLSRMIVVGIGISGAALLFLVYLSGSFSQHFLNLSLNRQSKVFVEDASTYGQLAAIAPLFALTLTIALAYRPELVRRAYFWVLTLCALACIYLATGKRSTVLAPVVMGTITWMLTVRKVPLLRLAIAGCVMAVVFASMTAIRIASVHAGSLEEVWQRADFDPESLGAWQTSEFSTRAGSYSSMYPILHYVPNESPLLWGETYLTILFRPIPRSIMPSKPMGTDYRAGAEFFNAVWGIPPGPVAEAYWNFHIPGVIGVFFLTGVFYRWMANFYLKYRAHGAAVFLYLFFVNGFVPGENAITGLMQGTFLALVALFACGALRLFRPNT